LGELSSTHQFNTHEDSLSTNRTQRYSISFRSAESVGEQLLYSHRGWVAEGEGQVIGFAIGNRLTGEMWVIAVLKEYEGHGIGMRLLTSVENWLFSEGWNEIWLTTDPDENCRAVGFYRHLGWKDWKLEPDGDRFMKKTHPNRFEHVQDGTESQ